jgi:PAS domain S-box-containing protein
VEKENSYSPDPSSVRTRSAHATNRYSASGTSHADTQSLKLLHELETQQTDLDRQYKSLLLAEKKAKTASDKFTALYDFAPTGYFTLNHQGIIAELNLRGAKILGHERSDLLHRSFQQFISPNSQTIFLHFLKKVLASTCKHFCKVNLSGHDDNPCFVRIEGISSDDQEQCFVTATDITEHHQMEEKMQTSETRYQQLLETIATLQKSEAHLRELNTTKDKFFSIMSHELRGPFNGIIGYSNLLIKHVHKKDFEKIEKYALTIQNSSWRAMNLLSNLTEWSHSQSGKIEFIPEQFKIDALINDVLELSADSAKQKSIIITSALPDNATALADKSMLSTIIRNLVSNAIKYTNPGGTIVIAATNDQKELKVTVCDNGIGMKKDTIDKLFRIETSFSTIGTQKEVGTGLGLLLCKEFVAKHKGKIWAESEFGKGSTFHFTIPSI